MGIKTYNPYTPSRRNMSGYDFEEITASTPEKSLTTSLKKHAGRNAQGKITVRHHGGGSRRKYRIIDFKRNKDGVVGTVKTIEYDPQFPMFPSAIFGQVYQKHRQPSNQLQLPSNRRGARES